MLISEPELVLSELPGRHSAEEEIIAALADTSPRYLCVLVADRVPLVNDRFGYREGDRLLSQMAERLTAPYGPARSVFRWSATSFVVLFSGPQSRLPAPGTESVSCGLFQLPWPGSARSLFDQVDQFVASHLQWTPERPCTDTLLK